MLDDLKQFFATSSVAEVGVGVTIGAAFAAVVAAAGDALRSLVAGEPSFGGLAVAAGTLLVVALLSVFGVVKPLLRLKERLARVQTEQVAAAVSAAREGDLAGAAGAARAAVAGDEPAALVGGDEPAAAPDGDDVPAGDGPLLDEGTGAEAAGDLAPAGPETPELRLTGPEPSGEGPEDAGAPAGEGAPEAGVPAAEPAAPWDPLTDPLPDGGALVEDATATGAPEGTGAGAASVAAAGDGAVPHGSPAVPGAAAAAALAGTAAAPAAAAPAAAPAPAAGAGPARPLPFAATTALKACPFCAFEVPAVATRCGWCTSDLGAVERAVDPVPVEG